jgi:hypothetical protein
VAKPRLLFILNRGRYLSMAPVLNRLLREGIIEDWQGVALAPPDQIRPIVREEDRARVHYRHDEPNPFATYAQASDFLHSLSGQLGVLDMGRIFSAEKYMDRWFPGGLIDLAHAFKFMKGIWDGHRLERAFSDYPAGAMDMMGYYLTRSAGNRPFYFTSSRIGINLLYLDSLEGAKADVKRLYARYLAEGLAPEDREAGKAYLDDFLLHKRKPYYFQSGVRTAGLGARIAKAWKAGAWRDPAAAWARMQAKRTMDKVQSRVRFSAVDAADRIVFHPMQYLPEASTYVRSPLFRDHVAIANLLAISLPAGYTLYIKDHPNLKAVRDEVFYRELLQFPNVKLVPYATDTHAIIANAKLTVTQSSTAGFESLLYGVPVLLLGEADILYQDFRGVLKLEGASLKDGMARAMAQPPIPDADKYAMIQAIRNAGYPGKMDDPAWDADVVSPENQENLYAFVKAKLQEPS